MATKKKAKKEKGLWAVWDRGGETVFFYSTKPKAKEEKCYACGKPYNTYSGTYITEMCSEAAKFIPGLVEGGEPVKIQVLPA